MSNFEMIASRALCGVSGGTGDGEPYPRLDIEERPGKHNTNPQPQPQSPPQNPPRPVPLLGPWDSIGSSVGQMANKLTGLLRR
jgi:hypothetical protein